MWPHVMREQAIRDQLARLLDWDEAHVGFDKAVDGIPVDRRGARASGFEHSPWQLVEHMRLAQDDLLDFCVNPNYKHALKWPDDYWPAPAPPSDAAWTESIASFKRSREKVKALARDVEDLTARVPTGKDNQTYLRAILLVADHNAYHVGQLVAVRRALGIWK
jgi:DinB superfamily